VAASPSEPGLGQLAAAGAEGEEEGCTGEEEECTGEEGEEEDCTGAEGGCTAEEGEECTGAEVAYTEGEEA
jgi:hypothetical protein